MQSDPRTHRRLLVYSAATLFFAALVLGLLRSAQALLLPITLGLFLGYLFRPLVGWISGSPAVKFGKGVLFLCGLASILFTLFMVVEASLPSEKEQLELMVRLQYRLNLRYRQWMGLEEKASGNWIYNWVGKDTDPIVKRLNRQLSLSGDQRRTFLQLRKSPGVEGPISDTYYGYFLSNLRLVNEQLDEPVSGSGTGTGPDSPDSPNAARPETAGSVAPPAAGTSDGSSLAMLLQTVSHWLVFPLIFLFVLFDKGQIQQFALGLVPNRYFEMSRTILDEVDAALGHYIRGTLLECLLVGITISVGLWLCGFSANVYVVVGLIGGLTNAIPFVGTAIALAAGCGFALIAEEVHPILPFVTLENLFVAVAAVVGVAHILDNAIYQPIVVGGAVNIHPLIVILAVFCGAMAFGFAGLLLAIPAVVVVKVVTETLFHELKAYRII
jgi:predicted PurR-regulated permease PerM